ncbi:hypothetical protein ACJX0J_009503 [Zea mays]
MTLNIMYLFGDADLYPIPKLNLDISGMETGAGQTQIIIIDCLHLIIFAIIMKTQASNTLDNIYGHMSNRHEITAPNTLFKHINKRYAPIFSASGIFPIVNEHRGTNKFRPNLLAIHIFSPYNFTVTILQSHWICQNQVYRYLLLGLEATNKELVNDGRGNTGSMGDIGGMNVWLDLGSVHQYDALDRSSSLTTPYITSLFTSLGLHKPFSIWSREGGNMFIKINYSIKNTDRFILTRKQVN